MPNSAKRRDERLEVRLNPKQFDAFAAAPDAPAKALFRLEKLLTTRRVVE